MKPPNLTPIKSSNIAAIGHQDGHLYVQFNSGQTWRYSDVPADLHQAMLSSDSPGRLFHGAIKNAFAGERVES